MNPAGRMTAAAPALTAASCVPPVHKRHFYANNAFPGKPTETDRDSAVHGGRAPAPRPADTTAAAPPSRRRPGPPPYEHGY
ncbi:hypothetical protein GCM10009549_45520 [Streptomyces thermoalcalitolerans]|uniref:Uncharacterized protein n=1 Tax=Streptomyces thermoalcalitolerans TaxID=65605 RepID=A0ABN1P8Y8_9ACTN